MTWFSRAAAFQIFLLASGFAHAAAVPRAATSGWTVDAGGRQCAATRNYGSADKPLLLALKPAALGNVMQITLLRRGQGSEGAVEASAVVQIDGNPPIPSNLLAFNGATDGRRLFRINLPSESLAPLWQATGLSIKSSGEIDESFALDGMPALMDRLDRCLADLRRAWNIEASAKAALQARVKGNLSQIFSDKDYPRLALQRGEAGIVAFGLLIDETGKVADCMLLATSNVPVLDAQSCAIVVERARFTPAVGADGKPARDAVISRIRWVMQK
jgi:hypothetical protein